MPTGTVKKVKTDAGYGFIAEHDGGADLFFHRSSLIDLPFDATLQERTVRFDVEQSVKGPRACNVRPE